MCFVWEGVVLRVSRYIRVSNGRNPEKLRASRLVRSRDEMGRWMDGWMDGWLDGKNGWIFLDTPIEGSGF